MMMTIVLKFLHRWQNQVEFVLVFVEARWPRVSALVSVSSGPCSCPGRGHCVVFLGKTLKSHSASLHPGV